MRHLGSGAAFLFCYYFWKDQITCFSCPCLGPEIWLEYAQYSIGGIGQEGGIEKVRSIFERALTAVGLHVTKGTALWEAYREFENAILETAQVSPFPWAPIPKKTKKKLWCSSWSHLELSLLEKGLAYVSQLFLSSPLLQENHSVCVWLMK